MFKFEKDALTNLLKSAGYPCKKQQLIQSAEQKNLPLPVLSLLQRLPDQDYASFDDVNSQLTVKV